MKFLSSPFDILSTVFSTLVCYALLTRETRPKLKITNFIKEKMSSLSSSSQMGIYFRSQLLKIAKKKSRES